MRGSSIARHPDVDYIIAMVRKGLSSRAIAKIINGKYAAYPKYKVNWMTIDDFIHNFMHLSKEEVKELREIAKENGQQPSLAVRDRSLLLQEKIQRKNEIMEIQEALAERRIDVQEELEKLFETALSEIDTINNRVREMKYDKDFIAGKATLMAAIEQVRKLLVNIKEEQSDSRAQAVGGNNVIIQFGHIDGYVRAMKQAIVETFRELGYLSELPIFLNKLSAKISQINSIEIKDNTGNVINITNDSAVRDLTGGNDE